MFWVAPQLLALRPGARLMSISARRFTKMTIDPRLEMFPPDDPGLRAIADAICEALSNWMKEPLHLMAYEDAARAAIAEMEKQR